MKRLYCFLGILLLVFMLVPVNAQTSLGFIGGLNLANVSVDPDMDVDWENLNGIAMSIAASVEEQSATTNEVSRVVQESKVENA